jgi:hypothetical protein
MTATASSLSALRAAARDGDRVAMLLLADLAEEQGDDARAGAWRYLAGPPREGWERRAWELLPQPYRDAPLAFGFPWARARLGRRAEGVREIEGCMAPGHGPFFSWDFESGWRLDNETVGQPPPEVREAVLAACRAVLAGLLP